MPLSSGIQLGHYKIQSLIGKGGMGDVSCAVDMKLEREVAVKVLPATLAGNDFQGELEQGSAIMQDSTQAFADRVRANQQRLCSELRTRFDYIVCGAGTSGCVVAGRLAADLNTQVLLLEAGGTDEADVITDPNRWPIALGSDFDWGFVAEPNPNLNGRAIGYSMGKALGGGSSINVSTWSRGHRADWDFYASESGNPAWGYEAILDIYRRRIEAYTGNPDPYYRGTSGTVHVQLAADPHPFSLALLECAESAGLRRFPNPNGRMMEGDGGCALVDETVCDGKKRS